MHISITTSEYTLTSCKHNDAQWLDMTKWSGTHEAGTRKIEATVCLYFKDIEDVDAMIAKLDRIKDGMLSGINL